MSVFGYHRVPPSPLHPTSPHPQSPHSGNQLVLSAGCPPSTHNPNLSPNALIGWVPLSYADPHPLALAVALTCVLM